MKTIVTCRKKNEGLNVKTEDHNNPAKLLLLPNLGLDEAHVAGKLRKMLRNEVPGDFGVPKARALIRWTRALHIDERLRPFIEEAVEEEKLLEILVTT
ncbi:hypothetical protein V6N13_068716 [Hibiscus sabdariffa]|uniref:Uncharacterized protein n=1 Tax=Hibiscus sabdariffa TaxID=183260 RepID=A0ABR2QNK4_9ROSI